MAKQNVFVNGFRMEPNRIFAGTRGSYITDVSFSFSPEWEGLKKKLIFYPVRGTPVYTVYTHGTVRIPAKVMRLSGDSTMLMSGYRLTEDGKIGEKIITASASVIVGAAESDTRNEPDIPEATVFEEIVAKLGAPYIGETGNWFVWDVDTHEFVDTGLPSRGERGETGRGLTILGKYPTLDELRSSVTDAKPGDAYGVGESAPYTVYIWDEVVQDFTDHGDLRGIGIEKIEQITDNKGSGEANTIRIYSSDGSTYDVFVYNGERGLPGNIWIGSNQPPDDSYEIWLNPSGEVSGYVPTFQGTDNAGRVLVVGEDGMVAPGEYAGGGGSGGIEKETDPTVPAWAKQPEKPTYTAEEVGAQPKGEYLTKEADPTVPAWAKQPEKPTYTAQEIGAQPEGDYALRNEIPSVPVQSVNGKTGAVQLNAGDVGARPSTWMPSAEDVGALPASTKIPAKTSDLQNDSGFVTAAVASLLNYYLKTETYAKGETYSQTELDALISGLDRRISAIADSDDTTLDQLSEIVAYIKANKSLIDSITTSKVSVADIVDNLTTSVANKPLSAAQGVALKKLIDALGTGKLDAAELQNAINTALAQAKASGEFDGAPGKNGTSATHSWNGTTLTITSASGTSSADLKGDPGKSAYAYAQDSGYAGTETEFSEDLSAVGDKVSKTGITLGLHSDGKYYIFIDGAPVGTGFELSGSSGDVFGYVDDNNNIVLNGNLADGTYSIKYEMEDGSTVDIGDLVLDTNVYYSVTNNLTNCVNSNSATQVVQGESYAATITANSGYELKSVTVTMGGSPVTVSGGTISIANVTGNIVITAAAEEKAVEFVNQIPVSTDTSGNLFVGASGEKGYKTGYRLSLSSGGETAASGYECTGFIPVQKGDVVRIKNIDLTDENSTNWVAYDSDKNPIKVTTSTYGSRLYAVFVTYGSELNGVYTTTFDSSLSGITVPSNLAYIRIGSKSITDASILTVNEEIM